MPVLDALIPSFGPDLMLPLPDDIELLDCPMVPELCIEPEFGIVPEDGCAICARPAEAMVAQAADIASKVMRFMLLSSPGHLRKPRSAISEVGAKCRFCESLGCDAEFQSAGMNTNSIRYGLGSSVPEPSGNT